jgi:hypothetical protein
MSEEFRPEEVYITEKLTLKDFYDIRTLRLLLWTLKTELCEKHEIAKACEVATRLKPTIETKLKEIEAKL